MSRSHAQAGDSKIGCILWSLLLAVGILAGVKMIPVKVKTSELYDFMVEQAKWAASASEETLARRIVDKGRQLDLPFDQRQVKVEKLNDRVRMQAVFVVPIEFPGYTYDWQFDLKVERPIYVF
jgi:hypothetical protein